MSVKEQSAVRLLRNIFPKLDLKAAINALEAADWDINLAVGFVLPDISDHTVADQGTAGFGTPGAPHEDYDEENRVLHLSQHYTTSQNKDMISNGVDSGLEVSSTGKRKNSHKTDGGESQSSDTLKSPSMTPSTEPETQDNTIEDKVGSKAKVKTRLKNGMNENQGSIRVETPSMTPNPEHESQNQEHSIEDKFNELKEEHPQDDESFRQSLRYLLQNFANVCKPGDIRDALIKCEGNLNPAFTLLGLETGLLEPKKLKKGKKSKRVKYPLEDQYPENDDETRANVNFLIEVYENYKPDFLRHILVNECIGDPGEVAEYISSHDPQDSWFNSDVGELENAESSKNKQHDRKGKKRDHLGELKNVPTEAEIFSFKKQRTTGLAPAAEWIRNTIGTRATGVIIEFDTGPAHKLKFHHKFIEAHLPGLKYKYDEALKAFKKANPHSTNDDPDIRIEMPGYLNIESFNFLVQWCCCDQIVIDEAKIPHADKQIDLLLETALFGHCVGTEIGSSDSFLSTLRHIINNSRDSLKRRHITFAFSDSFPLPEKVQELLVKACIRGLIEHRNDPDERTMSTGEEDDEMEEGFRDEAHRKAIQGNKWKFALSLKKFPSFGSMLLSEYSGVWWNRKLETVKKGKNKEFRPLAKDPLNGEEFAA